MTVIRRHAEETLIPNPTLPPSIPAVSAYGCLYTIIHHVCREKEERLKKDAASSAPFHHQDKINLSLDNEYKCPTKTILMKHIVLILNLWGGGGLLSRQFIGFRNTNGCHFRIIHGFLKTTEKKDLMKIDWFAHAQCGQSHPKKNTVKNMCFIV